MQTSRTAIRTNRKGHVLKVVSEHYLRDDITLNFRGLTASTSMNPDDESDDDGPAPSPDGGLSRTNPVIPHPRLDPALPSFDNSDVTACSPTALLQGYVEANPSLKATPLGNALSTATAVTPIVIIPDHSVFSAQMDVLESGTAPFASQIILQSVMDEMRHRHYRTYQRMRALIKASSFEASTTLKQNFVAKSVSAAAMGDDEDDGVAGSAAALSVSTLVAHATVFANTHHRSTWVPASDAADLLGITLDASAVKGDSEAMNDDPTPSAPASSSSESDDDDEDDLSSLRPLVNIIDHGSAAAASLASAKSAAADAHQDALILAAGRYLSQLLSPPRALPIVLTNSPVAAAAAQTLGVASLTVAQYVAAMTPLWPRLEDVLNKAAKDEEAREGQKWEYAPHLSDAEMRVGLQAGTLLKGLFDVNRDYWSEGSVSVPGKGRVFIPSFRAMNRAFHGDSVVVRMLPQSQWKAPSTRLAPPDEEASKGEDEAAKFTLDGLRRSDVDNDDVEAVDGMFAAGTEDAEAAAAPGSDDEAAKAAALVAAAPSGVMPTAEVVGIWSREVKPLCGMLEETDKQEGSVFFIPVNKRYPRISIQTKQIQELMDKRVMVAFDSWSVSQRHPTGHLVRVLGVAGDHATETEVVLLEHEVRHGAWSKAVEACLPGPDYEINDAERAGRVDLRGVNVCSIDPPGCVDIDDALHCTRLADGCYEVGVHIADVTHYVKPGSALDIEAATRSTSVYLVDRRIDMIPARLSTNICSLHEKVERLAFSVIWKLNDKAEILDTKFFKSVISSRGALSYAEAQQRIDLPGDGDGDPITEACKDLMMLARLIKAQRIAKGAVTLASSEVKFVLNKEDRMPSDVTMYQMKEANSLVEEFMLLANVSVAQHILRAFPTLALLRRHPTPPPEMLQPLVRAARSWGFDVDISSGKALNDSLNKINRPNDPIFNKVVRMLTTRCMTQAVYVASGEANEKQFAHFGLAAQNYTHFTSPIRRYSDIIAHRLLAASLGIAPLPEAIKDRAHMRDVVDNLNHRHRMAQLASRASTDVFAMIFFTNRYVEEDAVVVAVKSTGIRVLIPRYGIECAVKIHPATPELAASAAAKGVKLVHDQDTVSLSVGPESFKILQRVRVSIQVKENKMRRKWMAVELTGYDQERLARAFGGATTPMPKPDESAAADAAAAVKKGKKGGKATVTEIDDDEVIDVAADEAARKAAAAAAVKPEPAAPIVKAVGRVGVVKGIEEEDAAEVAAPAKKRRAARK